VKALLAVPLAPAAALAATLALVDLATPTGGLVLALAGAIVCGAFGLSSADRPRRLVWSMAAVTAAALALRPFLPPLLSFDLAHAGPLDGLRDALADPLRRALPEPESGLVRGILLGERASLDPDLSLAFARTGLTHVLVIDGLKMTLVATGLAVVVRRLPPIGSALVVIGCLAFYSVLVGLAPSVLRAALMAFVAAAGLAFGRRTVGLNALAAAGAAMLVLDPGTITKVGFQLSVLGTAGLLVLARPLEQRLHILPSWLARSVATTLAATIPILPLVAAVFGRVSVISPLANLLGVPLVPFLMLAGGATAVVGVFSPDLAAVPAIAAYVLAFALRLVAEWSSAVPLAAFAVPDGQLPGALYAVIVAGVLWAARSIHLASVRVPMPNLRLALRPPSFVLPARPRVLTALAAVAVLATASTIAAISSIPPQIRVRALDVGQGDAFLVEIGPKAMLIDGGPDPARLLAELGASLPPWRRRIDVVALTHAHADHADGLIGVLERYDVGITLEPVGLNPGPVASAWGDRIARAHVERRVLAAGARVRVGDATVTVLAPDGDPRVDVPSLVLRLERGSFSMLFMGDATEQAQADLLLRAASLATRVYVPPHHGAATPYASALVDAVHPSAAVISVGAQNRYGHPTPETLAALSRVTTYRTDRDGTVELDLDGTSLAVRTHANDLPPPRGGFLPHAPPAG
jgi:competence protein ComEC